MLNIGLDNSLSIIPTIKSLVEDVSKCLDQFARDTVAYNSIMQDEVAKEATAIINDLCRNIDDMRELIEEANKKAGVGISGLKRIEDKVAGGSLR